MDKTPPTRLNFLLLTGILLAGCDSGSGSDTAIPPPPDPAPSLADVIVSGVVEKGPFQQMRINAWGVDAQGLQTPLPADINGNQYSVSAPQGNIVYLEATGTFINEVTGELQTLEHPLKAITPADGQPQNINLFTDLAAQWVLGQSATPDAGLLQQGEQETMRLFGLPPETDPGQLGFADLRAGASLRDPSLQLLLVSAFVMSQQGALSSGGGLGGAYDAFRAGFGVTPDGGKPPMDFFGGMDPVWLLDAVKNAGVLGELPLLDLGEVPVLVCNSVCGWLDPGKPSISLSGTAVYESDGVARLQLSRTGTDLGDLAVTLEVTPGTALAGDDYLTPATTLTFAGTERTADVPLELIIDTQAETDETLTVRIVSVTDNGGNPVTLGQSSATVIIRDGAPATAGPAIAPSAVCLIDSDQGDRLRPATEFTAPLADHCQTSASPQLLLKDETPLLRLGIALTSDCASGCSDQLLDLALTTSGDTTASVTLGQFHFPAGSVSASGEMTELPVVALNDNAAISLLLKAAADGETVQLSARSVADPSLAAAAASPTLLPLPTAVQFGDRTLNFDSPVTDPALTCPDGSLAIADQYGYSLSTDAPEATIGVTGSACIEIATLNSSAAAVTEADIDLGTWISELPDWHFMQLDVLSGAPTGAQLASTVSPLFIWDYNALVPGIQVTTYLGAEHLPFLYAISDARLTETGLELLYSGTRLRTEAGFADSDPRAQQGFSNLSPYMSGQAGRLRLTVDGITTSTTFAARDAVSAYPLGILEWHGFSADVSAGQLAPSDTYIEYTLAGQTTACADLSCAANTSNYYQLSASSAQISSQGIVATDGILASSASLSWGANAAGAAWSSSDATQSGMAVALNLPGNNAQGVERATDGLQAHRTQTSIALPGSDDFIRGNQYPPGLTFGPQTYAGTADGQPDAGSGSLLTGTDLTLTTTSGSVSFDSSPATKWVVRNDGVTGVYNAAPASLPLAASLQGYDFTFARFAIRTRMNEVDEYNWVDGGLLLSGDAGGDEGWEINFTNQIIACDGTLGRSVLAQEQCGGETCQLASWRADSTLIDMNFSTPASCDASQQLIELGIESHFLALDRPLLMSTTWNPDGSLVTSESRALDQYLLDQREDTDGFPIQVSDAYLIAPMDLTVPESMRYGTLGLNARVALPFWNALDGDARLANTLSFGLPAAEPSVLTPDLARLPQAQTTALNRELLSYLASSSSYDFDGRYEWGNTGMGFQLPVYYDDTNSTEQATFVGRTWSKDLYVMDVNAGINFIEPVRTSLSFGASADFEKLREVRFQIELGKGDGLSKVDDLLVTARLIDHPIIEPTFGVVNQQVAKVNQFAGRGIDELLEKALLEGLEQTGAAVGSALPTQEDPFDTLAGGLARLRSVPSEITSLMDERLFDPAKDSIAQLEERLRTPLQQVVSDIYQLPPAQPVPQAVYDQLATLQTQLDSAIRKTEQPFNRFSQLDSEVSGKLSDAQDLLTRVDDARQEVALILTDVTDIVTAQCDTSGNLGAEINGYLESSLSSVADLRTLAQLLQGSDLLVVIAELAADDPQVRTNLLKAQEKIQNAAADITSRLDTAEDALRSNLCGSDINLLLADAQNVLQQIDTATSTLSTSLSQATHALTRARQGVDTLQVTLIEPLRKFRLTLADAGRQLRAADTSAGGPALVALMDDLIAEASNGQLDCVVQHSGNASCDDLFTKITSPVTSEIDAFRDAAVAELNTAAAQHMPDVAYLSAVQLRGVLVARIMNSAPVRDVRNAVNTQLVEVMRQLQNALLTLTDKANEAVQLALQKVENAANDALDTALAPVKNIPLTSASLDGFATIAGNDIERLHIGAEWTMLPSTEGDPGNTFGAALDAVSWAANNKSASCGGGDNASNLDITISVLNVPANIGESELNLARVYLGFTLDGPSPIGVAGGLRAEGEIKFTEFQIYDPAFAAGLGKEEIYLGAAAGAVFSDIQAEVAFLAGKTCNQDILMDLDPKVAQFIPLPATGFTGAYVRGAASIPIYSNGCPLTIGAAADIGAWVLAGPPVTLGGLVGGGAYGKVGCVGALRGQIRALGQVNTDGDMTFVGEGFGVAGLGLCEPATWTSVERSRKDKLCGTGDAILRAGYMNGWSIMEMSVSAIH